MKQKKKLFFLKLNESYKIEKKLELNDMGFLFQLNENIIILSQSLSGDVLTVYSYIIKKNEFGVEKNCKIYESKHNYNGLLIGKISDLDFYIMYDEYKLYIYKYDPKHNKIICIYYVFLDYLCDFVSTLDTNYLFLISNDKLGPGKEEENILFHIFDIKQEKIINKYNPNLKKGISYHYYSNIENFSILQLMKFFDPQLYNQFSNNLIAQTKNKQKLNLFIKDEDSNFYFFYIDNKYSKFTINKGEISLGSFYEQITNIHYDTNYDICDDPDADKHIEDNRIFSLRDNNYFYFDEDKRYLFLFTDEDNNPHYLCNRFVVFYK